jgi:hypothetical protein
MPGYMAKLWILNSKTEFICLFNGKTYFGWMFSVLKIFPKNHTRAGTFVCYKRFSVC